MKKIVILGSTGIIGSKALEVVRDYPNEFQVVGLAAGHESEKFKDQIREFKPKIIGIGENELVKVATIKEAELVIVAVVGRAGIKSTLEAIKLGKNIGLATKEVLVLAGEEVMSEAEKNKVTLIPIDSEHSAIWQSLKAGELKEIKQIYLTMGKGKISEMSEQEKEKLTPEQVLNRKTWVMGKKIGIDSATGINKAFEVIEAKWLFDLKPEQIKIVVHPEYLCHSMAEFVDGSVIAELGVPDMKRYVQYAMFYPERMVVKNLPKIDFLNKNLSFTEIDFDKFPGVRLGYTALGKGRKGARMLYETDELAVDKFLKGKIKFTEIIPLIQKEMEKI